jgi:hypothetical protein
MADFDLGGLLFGNAPSSGLESYLDPEQLKRMQNQGVMQAAMALLKASGPSAVPIGIGQALGEAYGAGQTGYQQAQQQGIAGLLTKQKLEEAKRAQELQQNVGNYLSQETPEGVSPTEFKAQQYMKLADLYAARNPEQASKFFDMAQKLTPAKAEVTGQPFQVSDAQGKPILVQQFKDGTIRPMEGFGPQREVVLQNVDGVMTAIDKSALKGGEKFGTGVSAVDQARIDADNVRLGYELKRLGFDEQRIAMEKKRLGMEQTRLGISQAEFARGGYDRLTNEQGVFYVPKTPGLPVIPISGPGGEPLKGTAPPKATESEQNAAGFAQRMERADAIANSLAGQQPGLGSSVAGSIPLIGGMTKRLVQPGQTQQFEQAANDWIRAKLRKESGAAIGKDEMESEFRTYFPMVGDTAAVITQKAEARRIATDAMRLNAGGQYRPYVPSPNETSPPNALGGTLTWDPVKKQWVNK